MLGAVAPLHTVTPPEISATGLSITVILKVTGVPVHLSAFGVIVIVAVPVIGVNDGISVTSVTSANPMAAPPEISKTA